ncbi:MAG: hypothetical protein R6X20_02305 [Phycisphaerae bacterium]
MPRRRPGAGHRLAADVSRPPDPAAAETAAARRTQRTQTLLFA